MQTNEDIVNRFYQAVDALYAVGEIKRVAHFERECGINHGTFYKLRIDPTRHLLRPAWLAHLVEQYGVSADWLLLGRGRMFE